MGRFIRFATTDQATDAPATDQATTDIVEFPADLYAELLEILDLTEDAEPVDIIDAVKALTEGSDTTESTEDSAGNGERIAARQGTPPTIIDGDTWEQLQSVLKVGLRARSQEKRLAAEQVVDQAIRLGKAQAPQREQLIQSYGLDPEETVRRLRKGQEVPFFEIGHSQDPDQANVPKGWVR